MQSRFPRYTSPLLVLPLCVNNNNNCTKRCSAVGSASDSRAKGPGFDTRSEHILSFLLPLIQEGQLSVTGELRAQSITKYWLNA